MSQPDTEMVLLKCGSCNRNLRVASTLSGRRVRCPKCKAPLQVPTFDSDLDSDEEYFPDWLKIIVAIPLVLLFFGILSLAIGQIQVVLLILIIGCLTALIWKKDVLLSYVEKWQQEAEVKASIQKKESQYEAQESQKAVAESKPIDNSNNESGVNIDHLFEIQTQDTVAPQAITQPGVSSPPPQRSNIKMVSRWVRGASVDDVIFYGPGSVATVDKMKLESPLIYLISGTLNQPYDASLIETGLPVAISGLGAHKLPYWPSYRQCSPEQRRNYLNWLNSGRRNPLVELGYVFIYFYGLERRIVLERRDSQVIITELLRLLSIYKFSRSFQRYCSSLLWRAALVASEVRELNDESLKQIIDATEFWSEANLSALLSIYQKQNLPIPPDVAFLVAENDSRSLRSVVLKRHPDKFRELFCSRFTEMYKDGLRLKTSKRDFCFDYRPASESLIGIKGGFFQNRILLPNTLGIPSQFNPLTEIWSAVIDDLKSFDRVQRKFNDDEGVTADVYEALPVELRNDDHPDFDAWYQIIEKFTDNSGVALISVSELAKVRGISERPRLTKKQCEQILNSADCMDLCLEPDSRETGQNYRWDEFVSVFPREYDGSENLKSYHAASILLRLGMSIACADGTVDKEELEMITTHLEQQFNLSPQESVRLEHLSLLLSRYPADETSLARKLMALPEEQRNIVGDLLVGIASADDIITPDETKALKKAFRNLKLDPDRIDQLTEGVVSVEDDSSAEAELVLNHDRIREIMSETSQVAEFLQNVMIEDEEEVSVPIEETVEPDLKIDVQPVPVEPALHAEKQTEVKFESDTENTTDFNCTGLDVRYQPFLKELLSRSQWSRTDLETCARSQGLMLMGALEAINEWSLDSLGDWLIDESEDTVQIATDLINTTS
ncbi:TerB N-terminal domain-containing protein [Gimesia maris]|uniref:tellurite resistance TerB family protein n=1 Tax=Gimesia maris TaxID=122 RepID=UPI00241C55B9|nr:TerB N-terminal domain-containing protein [Gimesia maris]